MTFSLTNSNNWGTMVGQFSPIVIVSVCPARALPDTTAEIAAAIALLERHGYRVTR